MSSTKLDSLELLGFTPQQIQDIDRIQMVPHGLFAVSGIAGQGRSKTASTLVQRIIQTNASRGGQPLKAVTVNNYARPIPGTTGLSRDNPWCDDEVRLTLRKALSLDPDCLFVDEVCGPRSADSLRMILESGHSVIGVIHAPGALSIPRRLVGMGMGEKTPFKEGFLSGLLYQRLVPKLCGHCSVPLSEAPETNYYPEVLQRLRSVEPGRDLSNIHVRNPSGCEHCRSGSVGRTVVAEVVPVTDQLMDAFAQGGEHGAREFFIKNGGMTIMAHAIEKVLSGELDPVDAEYHVGVFS